MKTILIVDPDGKFQRVVVDGLRAYGSVTSKDTKDLIVKSASDGKEAAGVLKRFKIDLVVTDIEGAAVDGLGLITYMRQGSYKEIPVVAVTADPSPETKSKMDQLGVTHYVKKPFVLLELMERMLDALDESSGPLISDFTVPNFLQALKMEKKTCTLEVTSEGHVGYMHLQDGELIDAGTDELTGDSAAVEIFGWENTDLNIEELSSDQKRIKTPVMQLLMQASRAREKKAEAARTPDSILEEIVTLADGGHKEQAVKKLMAFIKADPNNYEGWLWHSRITDRMEWVEKSLNNAKKIAPDDPEVLKEVEKFELAKEELKEDKFLRCPFCWAVLNPEVLECPSCRAYLFVDGNFLTHTEPEDPKILREAVDRYTKVVNREESPSAYYYLGMAYLNLGQWEKGIDQLNNTAQAFPELGLYADQLQTLMDLLISSKDFFAQQAVQKKIGSDLPPESEAEAGRKKILVAESNRGIRKVISIMLSKRGYEVLEAEDGLETLNLLDRIKPQLILMDIDLAKIDAQSVLSVIRENSEHTKTPIVVLTSKSGLFKGGKQKLIGSTANLPKPFDLSKMLKTIERYL
ncbi:MAG: response regulator [Deltaproteobacteria bacterium]|nr:response regulator [Deltaproteobacteria bacterium]MBW2171746.1 response regulator [Deltaproteobacteria bacterium]